MKIRKNKYNFHNPLIVLQSENGEFKNADEILKYTDKLFDSFKVSENISYYIYTSKITTEEAIKKFNKQMCSVCGTITNKIFLTYRGKLVVGRSLECEICFPEIDYLCCDKKAKIELVRAYKYKNFKKIKNYIKRYYNTKGGYYYEK